MQTLLVCSECFLQDIGILRFDACQSVLSENVAYFFIIFVFRSQLLEIRTMLRFLFLFQTFGSFPDYIHQREDRSQALIGIKCATT